MKYLMIVGITLLFSCTQKKYTYREGSKEQIIEAPNDSAAYAEAVKLFEISKMAHDNVKNAYGDYGAPSPISFDLFDANGKRVYTIVDEAAIKHQIGEIGKSQGEQMKNHANEIRFKDTIGISSFPVKITKAVFSREEYSNYKNVSLTYKNISGKKINAIRFRWYGENSFGEPADMTSITDGWGSGFDDSGLGIGKTGYGTWNAFSRDGKKIIVAYPTEVAFADGTKWENPN